MLFRNNTERQNAKVVIESLKNAGAEQIGVSGSRICGEVKKDDFDIVVTWPRGHVLETQQVAVRERFLPNGASIPKPFDVITINREDQGALDPVGTSARHKARWLG